MPTPDASALVHVYKELTRLGLNTGSSGNVSTRTPEGMLITPSGASATTLTEAALVPTTLAGAVQGKGTPSSEWHMHAAIYRAHPTAGAIVHTHADACTALACLNEPLPAFHYNVVQFGGADVRCAPYVTFGTPALAEAALAAMHNRTACLLANHGMITTGRDPEAALAAALALETLARQYLLARSAGAPRILTEAEVEAARERYRSYGPQQRSIQGAD